MTHHSDLPQVRRRRPPKPQAFSDNPIVRWVSVVGYTICGLVATAPPLVLWMSWSETVYYLTILSGFLACCGIVALSKFLPEYREAERREGDDRSDT